IQTIAISAIVPLKSLPEGARESRKFALTTQLCVRMVLRVPSIPAYLRDNSGRCGGLTLV
ncbi:hypothetical protein GOA53_27955, partial [Sinorhizobium meliloti]|nr:hypothetical protein [Sinorhizobium meliloti]